MNELIFKCLTSQIFCNAQGESVWEIIHVLRSCTDAQAIQLYLYLLIFIYTNICLCFSVINRTFLFVVLNINIPIAYSYYRSDTYLITNVGIKTVAWDSNIGFDSI